MRLPTTARVRGVQLNMTPMIDVVFLLIIFFLLSSHLARQETQLELDLPTAGSGQEDTVHERPRVTINVLPNGEILLGTLVASQEELAGRLSFERQRSRDLEVRIRSDRSVPYGLIEPILLACAEADIWNVTFAVVEDSAEAANDS